MTRQDFLFPAPEVENNWGPIYTVYIYSFRPIAESAEYEALKQRLKMLKTFCDKFTELFIIFDILLLLVISSLTAWNQTNITLLFGIFKIRRILLYESFYIYNLFEPLTFCKW